MKGPELARGEVSLYFILVSRSRRQRGGERKKKEANEVIQLLKSRFGDEGWMDGEGVLVSAISSPLKMDSLRAWKGGVNRR